MTLIKDRLKVSITPVAENATPMSKLDPAGRWQRFHDEKILTVEGTPFDVVPSLKAYTMSTLLMTLDPEQRTYSPQNVQDIEEQDFNTLLKIFGHSAQRSLDTGQSDYIMGGLNGRAYRSEPNVFHFQVVGSQDEEWRWIEEDSLWQTDPNLAGLLYQNTRGIQVVDQIHDVLQEKKYGILALDHAMFGRNGSIHIPLNGSIGEVTRDPKELTAVWKYVDLELRERMKGVIVEDRLTEGDDCRAIGVSQHRQEKSAWFTAHAAVRLNGKANGGLVEGLERGLIPNPLRELQPKENDQYFQNIGQMGMWMQEAA